jgi:hypothetical protein
MNTVFSHWRCLPQELVEDQLSLVDPAAELDHSLEVIAAACAHQPRELVQL